MRESYGESEKEDEFEGEFAELLEEAVAEDDEAGADEGETRSAGVECRQNPAIVNRKTSGNYGCRHYFVSDFKWLPTARLPALFFSPGIIIIITLKDNTYSNN